ncbi:hypothetical protein BDV09DRAFT_199843 [Aspergillus tetrazonus]
MSSIASMTEEDSAVAVQKEVCVTEDVKSEHNQNEANSYPGYNASLGIPLTGMQAEGHRPPFHTDYRWRLLVSLMGAAAAALGLVAGILALINESRELQYPGRQ